MAPGVRDVGEVGEIAEHGAGSVAVAAVVEQDRAAGRFCSGVNAPERLSANEIRVGLAAQTVSGLSGVFEGVEWVARAGRVARRLWDVRRPTATGRSEPTPP